MSYRKSIAVNRAMRPQLQTYRPVEHLPAATVTAPSNQTFIQKVKQNANRMLETIKELIKKPSTYILIGITVLSVWAFNKYKNTY